MADRICNQRDIPHDRLRYGLRPSAAVGCGWIATYNALDMLGDYDPPEALIRYYERQAPLIHGNLGTLLWGPALYFRKRGYCVALVADRKRFDAAARDADACILYYHWRRGAKFGAHFVALEHGPEGFTGYNTFRNSRGPDRWGESIAAFMEKHKYFGGVLLTIRKKA